MNLGELAQTSLAQHDIKLDNPIPFKEHYQRIPLHQYHKVMKHLQEMIEIGAICKSTSLWASPSYWYGKRMVASSFVSILENLTIELSRMCRVFLG